jgi:putative FmdB family regulatory protein
MPTYEYECEKCHRVFEEFQNITAPALTRCRFEGCGGAVHRLLSGGAGFLFKGSGFYITDYRSESYKQKAKADKETAGTSSSSASSTATPPASDAKKGGTGSTPSSKPAGSS